MQDSPKIKIELVFLIEEVPKVHHVLEDVVMEAALKAVETFHDQVGFACPQRPNFNYHGH